MQSNNLFRDWLNRRKITDSVIEDFCIKDYNHENIGECIAIPVFDEDGNFLFNKFRRSPLDERKPKYLYQGGGKVTLYGWHKAKNEKTILITEGELDALVAWSANIPAITSTGGAMSFQADWAELLKGKDIILCFDNDIAGGEGMAKALDIVPHAKLLFLPKGIKDLTEYAEAGKDLNKLIQHAKHFDSVEEILADRSARLAMLQDTFFHDVIYDRCFNAKPIIKAPRAKKGDEDKVTRAKTFPIPEILPFKNNKAICPFHNEKTPSFTYYPKDNHCYCFGGCGRAYDAIDIYMKVNNCDFKTAIKELQ